MPFTDNNNYELITDGTKFAGDAWNANLEIIDKGRTFKRTLGENGTEGQAFYFDFATSKAKLAKADAVGTANFMGILTEDGVTNDERLFRIHGSHTKTAWGLTADKRYYLSAATAGAITDTKPAIVVEVGFTGTDTTKLYIQPNVYIDGIFSTANITDNKIVRGDGGALGIQGTGVTISDTDDITGVATMVINTSLNMGGGTITDVNNIDSDGGVIAINDRVTMNSRIAFNPISVDAVGPTDNLNIQAVNVVLIDTGINNVTIGGMINGIAGQVMHIAVAVATNNTTLEHNEGTGNQDIFLSSGGDETLTASYGGWTLACNGSDWYQVGQ